MNPSELKFVWDEPKRLANIDAHGLDLADAQRINWERAVVIPTYPGPTGRPRFKAVGFLDERLVVVIFSPLGSEAVSVISMRLPNPQERRLHGQEQ